MAGRRSCVRRSASGTGWTRRGSWSGAGSDELIGLLIHSYGGPGTELLISQYAFSMYEIYARVAGCDVVVAPERERTIDVDAMLARVSPRTRLVFIANPNNPTGTLLPESEIARLRRVVAGGGVAGAGLGVCGIRGGARV